ncbi:hypothetical protein [Aurantiacibacter rhizosphaerae]|uniref:Uncharacterized protein n=1 Tax=Aurantiacibacter rhizosphaerae TaxID=2691582 RepID=A0A844XDH0_9SPHN|nr:hypothetical protein [Aurantiacibacter rhizosphaerae]MWV27664.1 hypothetical protein [Aurantiacibacter rhizosphaerae]
MAERTFTDEQLALVLQASRDFAFEQIAQGMPVLPFACVVKPDGEMGFTRFAEPGTDKTPDEVLALTHSEVAKEAASGGLIAAAIISAVKLDQPDDGMDDAIRIQVEAPGFARHFLAYYSVGDAEGGSIPLQAGRLVPFDADPAIFDG